jgi:hypothetical protein
MGAGEKVRVVAAELEFPGAKIVFAFKFEPAHRTVIQWRWFEVRNRFKRESWQIGFCRI